MLAFEGPNSFYQSKPKPDSNVVTIDVGGQIFQTTKQTLTLAGPKSILSTVFESPTPFIDRDPELFSVILSLLRTGNFPLKAKGFDLQDLVNESRYYGVENMLMNSLSNPNQFEALNLEKSLILPLNGRDSPSTITTTPHGSVHVAHGSKITSFDWSLRRKSTILTEFSVVDSMVALCPTVLAAGATDFSGLQIIDLEMGSVKESLNWENVTRSSSTVQAIGLSTDFLFTSFESGRRNSNSIMVYDLQSLKPVNEIGHNEIFGADIDSAIPATKLTWVSGYNLLMAAGSHGGPSGVAGNIKMWDIRTGSVVWEVKEKTDCFADLTVSDNLWGIFKVGVNSGDVFFMDLRKLGAESSWVCLEDGRNVVRAKKEGVSCRIKSHASQLFCSREGEIELWSQVMMGFCKKNVDGYEDRVFRKNLMGRVNDMGLWRITNLAFGGNKMFLTRKNQSYVEVWQS